jgi:hypothetical protein
LSPVNLDLKHQNVFLLEVNQPTNHVRLTVSNEELQKKNITNLGFIHLNTHLQLIMEYPSASL